MYTDIIIPTLIMVFLGIIAASSIVFPILYLVQKKNQHKDYIQVLQDILKKINK